MASVRNFLKDVQKSGVINQELLRQLPLWVLENPEARQILIDVATVMAIGDGLAEDDTREAVSCQGVEDDSAQKFGEECASHYTMLFKTARMLPFNSEDEVEDLVQQTLLQAIASHSSFRGDSALSTWLVGILKNKAIQQFRNTSRRDRLAIEVYQPMVEAMLKRRATVPSPLVRRSGETVESIVRKVISPLPPALKDAATLCLLQGLSYKEAGHFRGITVTAMYKRVERARAIIRERLKTEGIEKDFFDGS